MTRHITLLVLLLLLALVVPVGADTYIIGAHNDGNIYRYVGVGETYAAITSGAGTDVTNNASTVYQLSLNSHATTVGFFKSNYRYGRTYNSSVIGALAVITSGNVKSTCYSKTTTLLGQNESALVKGTPASATAYVAGDYDNFDPTELASRFDFTSTTSGDITHVLNAAGLAAINKTGYTVFYTLDGDELDGAFSGVWLGSASRTLRVYAANTTNVPFLTLTVSYPPVASFQNNTAYPLSGIAPLPVQFMDESTNTPTSWNWSIQNATSGWKVENQTQNATIVFPVAGEWDVSLKACNVAGCSFENKTAYVTVLGITPGTVCYYMNMTNATVQNATWTANVADGWVGVEANASNSTAFWYHCVTPATTATTPPPTPIPNLPAQPPVDWNVLQWWWIPAVLLIIWLVKK